MCSRLRTLGLSLALLGLGTASASPADSAGDDQYAVAARSYADGRWDLAVDEFHALLKAHDDHPRSVDALFYCGEALVQLERYAEARDCFAKLIERDPNGRRTRQALFRSGEAALLAGDYAAAATSLKSFRQQFAGDSLDVYALPYLAEAELELKHADAARELYDQALTRFPDGPLADNCRLGLGRALAQQRKWDEACDKFRSLADDVKGPLADQAQFQLGMTLATAERHAEAASALAVVDSKFPKSPLRDDARLARAWSLFKSGQVDEALRLLDSLAEQPERTVAAQYRRGLMQKAQGKWSEAAATLLAAAQLDERHALVPAIRFHAGDALLHDEKPELAESQFRSVLASKPSDDRRAQSRALLAVCCAKLKRFDEARKLYQELASGAPESELTLTTAQQLAEAAYAAGEPKWASELFASLSADGKRPELESRGLSGLGWSQFKAGDFQAAADTFQKLLASFPNDPLAAEAALARAQALEKLDQSDPALAAYRLVIDNYGQSEQAPPAKWRAARLHERLSQFEQAEVLYRRVAEEHPRCAEADDALHARAMLLVKLGRAAEAEKSWERLRHDFPKSRLWPEATYRLAERHLAAKKLGEAAKLAADVLVAKPEPAVLQRTLYLQGRIALADQKWDDVAAPLARLVHDFPDSSLAWSARYLMAESLYRKPDYAEAGDRFAGLDKPDSKAEARWRAMVRLRRAQIEAQLKEWQSALDLGRSVARDFPDFDQQYEADYLIGRCLTSQADFEGAREALRRVVGSSAAGKSETAAMAQWMVGETYFHQEDYAAAVREYLRVDALYAYPRWQSAALLQAGKCYEMLERWKDAAGQYARLVQEHPDCEFRAEADRRLETARQRAKETHR